MEGTPLEVLMVLAGWDDYAMARRYAHLAPTHVAEFAKKLDRGLKVIRTFSGTPNSASRQTKRHRDNGVSAPDHWTNT
jgi:hypothetical protein